MGRLDVQVMRHMTKDDYRVLTAVEMGMRNHHAVPVPLIVSIAGLRHGGAAKFLATLLRFKLVYHDNTKYDGYRLTWTGYDVLALNVFCRRGSVESVGRKIGEGKESDVFEGHRSSDGQRVVIKLHRLGKTSFKTIKNKRDYLDGRQSAGNWLNMSRLAAKREWDFLSCLHEDGQLRVPEPIDQNRHGVVMSLAPGLPLYQLGAPGCLADPVAVLDDCVHIARTLARRGLVHCDLNEFNLIVDGETSLVTLIDFPQMISTSHPNAPFYFTRDLKGLVKFFTMKLKYDISPDDVKDILSLENALAPDDVDDGTARVRLDVATKASGYDGKHDKRNAFGKSRGDDDASDDDDEDDGDDDGDPADDDGDDDAPALVPAAAAVDDDADEDVDSAALHAKFLAMARRDAPGADDAQAPPTQPPRTSFFDNDDVPDDAEALASQVRADICTRKLRRERTKQTAKRANHNGAGASRNFSKVVTGHGKVRHKERLLDSA